VKIKNSTMAKIKDKIEDERRFAESEPIKGEPNDYKFLDEKGEHMHTLRGQPLLGTSTIIGVIAKPLTYWASGKAVSTLGWTATKSDPTMRLEVAKIALEGIKALEAEDWLKRLDLAYKAHAVNLKETAKTGTDLHSELEKFVKDYMNGKLTDYASKIKPFVEWTKKNVKRFLASEAHIYSEKLHTGGIVDCIAELKSGEIVVMDFKSSKEAYPAQFLQTGGYTIQIEENGFFDKDGNLLGKIEKEITALAIVPFGAEIVEPVFNYDVKGCKEGFRFALGLYKFLNQYEK